MGRSEHRPRLLVCNWRDTGHPEGGGSEVYVEAVATGLAGRGWDVTMFTAHYPGAPREERRGGIRIVRRGGRLSVYAWGVLLGLTRRFGPLDAVLDVQNGVPFFTALFHDSPTVLVHHVHREQWPIVLDRRRAAIGWFIESRLAPRLYRRSCYVTVSEATRAELVGLGIEPSRIAVARNGTTPLPTIAVPPVPATPPRIVALGRLVPHKRVELAIDAVAALAPRFPGLCLDVVGQGYWEPELRSRAQQLGIGDRVVFHGFVSEEEKAALLARASLLAIPSVKEGWGIAVMEAASLGVPAVGFRSAGGLAESIVHGHTGLLAVDEDEFVTFVGDLLADPLRRQLLGLRARRRAETFNWDATVERVEQLLRVTMPDRRASGRPPARPAARRGAAARADLRPASATEEAG